MHMITKTQQMAHVGTENHKNTCHLSETIQDLDHEAELFETNTLGAKQCKGVIHLRLALEDPGLALHEARELLQAVLRDDGRVAQEGWWGRRERGKAGNLEQ